MEEIMDFDEFLRTVVIPEETYWFEFNENGDIISLHPGHAVEHISKKIQIDKSIVEDIYEGTASLKHYRIDITTGSLIKLSLNSINGLTKIDDVLHRIIDKKWSRINRPDISVEYSTAEKVLTFKINPLLKTLEWQGDQDLIFLITSYNDPNILLEMITINVNELVAYPHKINVDLPEKFSIYTRRLFDKYTFEIV